MTEYKVMLVKIKEDEWKIFVCENTNNLWGQVDKICRDRKREDITSLRVGYTLLASWRECAVEGLGTSSTKGTWLP